MIVAGIFLYLICCSVVTSGSIYGVENNGGEEWWTYKTFLKFFSPSGKNYLVNHETGELSLDISESVQESAKDVILPYISFVSLDLKVYDIFFEQDDAHIVEKQVNFEDKATFIRHSLHSFVGPNNRIYTVNYSNSSTITLESEKPVVQNADVYIKTYGPYSKWEHKYIFSENGETAMDITLSPVQISPDRSIPLAKMDTGVLKERNLLLASFNTPSGNRYLVTNELNIAHDQDELTTTQQSYIMFVEPNGKEYDIFFRNDGSEYVASMVAKGNVIENEDLFKYRREIGRLISFVGPDQKTYRIDRKNETGDDVPVLDSSPTMSTDFRITFTLTKNAYYTNNIDFIFSNEGKALYDRVDEYDPILLNKRPPLSIDEVDVNSEIAQSSFLTFYTPSGRTYFLTPHDRKSDFAVAKGSNAITDSPYIRYRLQDGRTSNIYYASTGEVDMKFSPADGTNVSTTEYWLQSFVTPDRKVHKMLFNIENDIRVPYIDITAQPKDPLDERQEDALRVTIQSSSKEYNYLFTWNGDKLIAAFNQPLKRVSAGVLKSLIG